MNTQKAQLCGESAARHRHIHVDASQSDERRPLMNHEWFSPHRAAATWKAARETMLCAVCDVASVSGSRHIRVKFCPCSFSSSGSCAGQNRDSRS